MPLVTYVAPGHVLLHMALASVKSVKLSTRSVNTMKCASAVYAVECFMLMQNTAGGLGPSIKMSTNSLHFPLPLMSTYIHFCQTFLLLPWGHSLYMVTLQHSGPGLSSDTSMYSMQSQYMLKLDSVDCHWISVAIMEWKLLLFTHNVRLLAYGTEKLDQLNFVSPHSSTASTHIFAQLLLLLLHSFNGLFSRTTWVRRHQKSRTILIKPNWIYWSKR